MSKIYIVEDDKSIRTELAELLENAGSILYVCRPYTA